MNKGAVSTRTVSKRINGMLGRALRRDFAVWDVWSKRGLAFAKT